MFWKFLLSIFEAWLFGVGCFFYFRYLPPAEILTPALFILSIITSIALPIAFIIWDEQGFRIPGLFWLLLNSLGAYLLTSAVISPQNITPWMVAIVAGCFIGLPIPLLYLSFMDTP